MIWTVYEIRDPITSVPVYVGQTVFPLWHRLTAHSRHPASPRLRSWILSARRRNLEPVISGIDEATSHADSLAFERWWIELRLAQGCALLNATPTLANPRWPQHRIVPEPVRRG